MRSSYSQNNTYITCPKHWEWSYVKKLSSPEQSAALYFGSAVDDAIMANLEGKENYMDVFYSRWTTARGYGNNPDIPLFDNPTVNYYPNDYDGDVLGPQDHLDMAAWIKTLRISKLGTDPLKVFEQIKKNIRNPYKTVSAPQEQYFKRCCWLSMKRKGEVLIDSFITQFKPKIKKVLATQKSGKLLTNGHVIFGYLDFVAEIEGYDKPVIIDLKTAARPYAQSKIDLTDQLTLYYAMAGEEFKTDLVGYVVLSKNINKNEKSLCKTCGHLKTGKHRTCDAVDTQGNRCGGTWDAQVELAPEVQVLVQQKTPKDKKKLMEDYGNIMKSMEMGLTYRNHDKCNNWYGGQCPFYKACHNDDLTGLVSK